MPKQRKKDRIIAMNERRFFARLDSSLQNPYQSVTITKHQIGENSWLLEGRIQTRIFAQTWSTFVKRPVLNMATAMRHVLNNLSETIRKNAG